MTITTTTTATTISTLEVIISRHLQLCLTVTITVASITARTFCTSVCSKTEKIKIYKSATLPLIVYGTLIWPVTIRENEWLGVIQNGLISKISGPRFELLIIYR